MTGHQKGKHERSPLQDQTEIRRQQILDCVRLSHEDKGIAPTYREIALYIGWEETSFGTVFPLVEDLIRAGFLQRKAKGARTLALVIPQPSDFYYSRSRDNGHSPYYVSGNNIANEKPRVQKSHKINTSPEFRERLKNIR